MKRVLKWTIAVDDNDHPVGAGPVLMVDCITPAWVSVWTEERVVSGNPPMRRARVVGTGQPVPDEDQWLGSTRHAASGLVWHVYGAPL